MVVKTNFYITTIYLTLLHSRYSASTQDEPNVVGQLNEESLHKEISLQFTF